LKYNFLI